MRKPMVAGNWKMHGTRAAAKSLLESISQGAAKLSDVDVVVLPSFVHLALAEELLSHTNVAWGAQNLYLGESGAFTGEVSGLMLKEYGCEYVLVGHSERRHVFHEGLALVADKLKAALAANLTPILCLGETLAQRENGETEAVVAEQLTTAMAAVGIKAFEKVVLAYEPVWAIGTGLTASPEQAQAVHAFIRQKIAQQDVALADTRRILYGGSVKADNASGLFSMSDIDGALVGGASLDPKSFLAICQAAS
ncbi:MAG: triose-phosphate isomerase [Gammaproteobacteria bacterium]|nr:triose-phosphate isomerase [Gammaproteobacteria bacterium]